MVFDCKFKEDIQKEETQLSEANQSQALPDQSPSETASLEPEANGFQSECFSTLSPLASQQNLFSEALLRRMGGTGRRRAPTQSSRRLWTTSTATLASTSAIKSLIALRNGEAAAQLPAHTAKCTTRRTKTSRLCSTSTSSSVCL